MIQPDAVAGRLQDDQARGRVVVLVGVECKRADAPRMTPSIRIAIEDLGLARVLVVYPGSKRFPVGERVEPLPLSALAAGEPAFPGMHGERVPLGRGASPRPARW